MKCDVLLGFLLLTTQLMLCCCPGHIEWWSIFSQEEHGRPCHDRGMHWICHDYKFSFSIFKPFQNCGILHDRIYRNETPRKKILFLNGECMELVICRNIFGLRKFVQILILIENSLWYWSDAVKFPLQWISDILLYVFFFIISFLFLFFCKLLI